MVDGREKRALELFNKSMHYLRGLQEEHRIECFDVAVLPSNDRDLRGFILMRGTAEQIDSVGDDEEFQRLFSDVQVVVDRVTFLNAFVDETLAQTMHPSQDVSRIGELD